MYAVVETGGKQYRVTPGDKLEVERLGVAAGESVTLDKVLMVNKGSIAVDGISLTIAVIPPAAAAAAE